MQPHKALLREQDAKIAETARGISITKHFVRVLQPLSRGSEHHWEKTTTLWQAMRSTRNKLKTIVEHMQFMGYPITKMMNWNSWREKQTGTEIHNTYYFFYYITINRSSTVWQKKWQIPDHFTAHTPKNIKNFKTNSGLFFFFFLNLVSGTTNIPVTQPNDGKTGSHCICSTSNKAQCTKCACFSLHYTKIVKIHSR